MKLKFRGKDLSRSRSSRSRSSSIFYFYRDLYHGTGKKKIRSLSIKLRNVV